MDKMKYRKKAYMHVNQTVSLLDCNIAHGNDRYIIMINNTVIQDKKKVQRLKMKAKNDGFLLRSPRFPLAPVIYK